MKITKPLRHYLKKKAGWLGIPKIMVYNGYGNEHEARISGRVIEDSGLAHPDPAQGMWENAMATIKRFAAVAYPGVRIEARLGDQQLETRTDELGFFQFTFPYKPEPGVIRKGQWVEVHFTLPDRLVENQPPTCAKGEFLLLPEHGSRIIVSDIDDTIMLSHATRVIKKLRLMLMKNAYSRLTFDGAPEFYNALVKGDKQKEYLPLFFISSSEWNLYDLLQDFMQYNKIPRSVFMLRRFNQASLKFWKAGGGNHQHKLHKIRMLMDFYPERSFVFIGDSGQQDLSIYRQLANELPERIDAIYIRKVKAGQSILDSLENPGISQDRYKEFDDTSAAIAHAREFGLIQ